MAFFSKTTTRLVKTRCILGRPIVICSTIGFTERVRHSVAVDIKCVYFGALAHFTVHSS